MTDDALLARDLLQDAFSRVAQSLPRLLEGLTPQQVLWQPDPAANSVGWLAWHLTRVQDDHIAGIADSEQLWAAQDWSERFGLPYPTRDIGFGQSAADVAAFDVGNSALLADYHLAVQARTSQVVADLTAPDLRKVVDTRWDPPVTAAVRLVSVINDTTQHLGQIGYLRGLIQRGDAEGSA